MKVFLILCTILIHKPFRERKYTFLINYRVREAIQIQQWISSRTFRQDEWLEDVSRGPREGGSKNKNKEINKRHFIGKRRR